ncbi:hypothetical protein [Clostridium sp. HBUAS56010]|uniref:hypothetical protein n=1 Tax=Clostridium sp. HBUAS56010 TaxID=2571127 RepID=UPI0011785BBE|nr:hypothetical protein [Clostridium sp. HBUAS56010]
MAIDLVAREQEIKNSYMVESQDGQYMIMQKDFYYSEAFNGYQDYYKEYKACKTLNKVISTLKKIVLQEFPNDYFNENNNINDFVKAMI